MSNPEMSNDERSSASDNQDLMDNEAQARQAGAGNGEDGSNRGTDLEKENAQLREQVKRTLADLENFRRRAQQERLQTIQYANERLLMDLLPIIDDVRRSVEAGRQSKDFDSFFQGVTMIDGKLQKLLESQGVRRMETIGKPFDVHLHEALLRQPSDAPEDTVIGELEPGFTYGDKVLRHAKVVLSSGN
jgi:molecular chaperone GrpE